LQNQQENRRLQYVALTRAKYHTYVFTNHAKTEDDALGAHIIPLLQTPTELENIRFISDQEGIFPVTNERNLELAPPEYISFEIEREEKRLSATASFLPAIPAISIKDSDWMKTSYSGLKREGIPIAKNSRRREWEQEYDQFVFHQLKKGSRTGDLLHYIFERIDFADSSGWRRTVEQAMNRYQIRETEDGYTERLLTCIQTVLTTELNTGAERFSLQSVQRENRVNELEFDVPLTSFSTAMLPEIIEDNIPLGLKDKGKISGILNGKMDLVFLHQGKYYLLDWKTNFLGDSTEDYRLPGLNAAMEEHHYFLQYYLYTLALSRFMKIRIPEYNYEHSFGGVFYLFVRGMRNHYDTGIYFHKPSENAILQLEALMLQHS
jgi:exodeoxyribonuclease V beta subunit